jgi:hypothetical protein
MQFSQLLDLGVSEKYETVCRYFSVYEANSFHEGKVNISLSQAMEAHRVGLQEVKAHTLLRQTANRCGKVVSPTCRPHFTSRVLFATFLVLISVRGFHEGCF